MANSNLRNLDLIAKALGPIKDRFVFVGGTVCSLYYDDTASPASRTTQDVDLIIEILTYQEWHSLENDLATLGFTYDRSDNAPICRKLFNGLKVDFMPTEEAVLNLKSRWFKEGFATAVKKRLPSGTEIKILAFEYFLASKFDAFFERGLNTNNEPDFAASKDFEDIVCCLTYNKSFLQNIPKGSNVINYLTACSKRVMQKENIKEFIQGHLHPSEPDQITNRACQVFTLLSAL